MILSRELDFVIVYLFVIVGDSGEGFVYSLDWSAIELEGEGSGGVLRWLFLGSDLVVSRTTSPKGLKSRRPILGRK